MADFDHVIRTRRTTRSYRDDPVPEALLQELVDLALLAPTASNGQPWRFAIATNREVLSRVNVLVKETALAMFEGKPGTERYRAFLGAPKYDIFYGAPALISILGPAAADVAAADCLLAAENLILAAHARGLGSCFMGFLLMARDNEEIRRLLQYEDGYEPIAPIAVGYSDAIPQDPPERKPAVITWVR